MERPVERATADDLDAIWEIHRLGFAVPDERRDHFVAGLDPERALVVRGDDGEVGAFSHIRRFAQWFGGRAVPLAGYSPVVVAPEHRGKGWARAVTAGHYPDLRERGEVLAGLFPASVALYRSVGFELAGSYVARVVPADHLAALRAEPDVAVRRGTVDDLDAVRRCYDRVAPTIDGAMARTDRWWERALPTDLAGTVLYVVDDPGQAGEVVGYGSYRHGPGASPYPYSVVVTEVVTAEPTVRRALWRVIGSSGSQAPEVEILGPAEDPLFLLVGAAAPHAVRDEIRWMARLVDVAGAVAARGWNPTASGRVDLSVVDEHAPWNTGRWRLEVEGGEGRLLPGGDGTVEVGIQGLSCWWCGYHRARTLAASGHLRTGDEEALATLDGLGAASPPALADFY